jgi:hypothetical protein
MFVDENALKRVYVKVKDYEAVCDSSWRKGSDITIIAVVWVST